ncbi:MAG: hypothetical protein IJ801_08555 [Lachnospiraceae bacterium]|nr:hypothetical protein [Lachnospiraceae bacterium]
MKKILKLTIWTMMWLLFSLQVFAEDNEDICQHRWSSWEVLEEPTCGETGIQERYCFDCNEIEYVDIPATGEHDWDDWYIIKSATISKTGLKERECFECDETETEVIPKLKPYISISKKIVKLRETKTYTIKIRYAKGDSVKKCKTSNAKVATMSKSGKIKAKNVGTAKFTIIMKSGKTATCKVIVSAKKKTSSVYSDSGTVYWTPNGSVYHKTSNCPTLKRSRTIYSGSVANCPKPRPCKVCY